MSFRDTASTPGPNGPGPQHSLPSSSPFRDHPASIVSRVHPRLFTPSSPLLIASCPLNANWRDSGMPGDKDGARCMSEEDLAICAAARRTRPVRRWYRVPLFWELGRNLLPDPPARAMHMHAEALINQRLVHLDFVSTTRASHSRDPQPGSPDSGLRAARIRNPGSGGTDPKDGASYEERPVEIRIFVDGRLAGIGGQCSVSPDEAEWSLPAVAVVERNMVISVGDGCDEQGPVVELWDVV